MGDDGRQSGGVSLRILTAAAIVVPLLSVLAASLYVGAHDDDWRRVADGPGPSKRVTSASDRPSPPQADARDAATAEPNRESTAAEAADPPTPVISVREGERVAMRDAPGGSVVAEVGDQTEFGSPSVFSVIKQSRRWMGVSSPDLPNDELGWIRADPSRLEADYVDLEIVVDLSQRRAELLDEGRPVRSWPVTIGAPESETPTGRFAVTDTFRGGLNPVYGCCAVAISATQPNLPAEWPGGDRIAFHGTTEPLGTADSYGCLRSASKHVSALVDEVPLGTPVTIIN